MKAVFYERNATIRVGPSQPQPPSDGQVQIRVAYGGICGTDLGIYHGKMDWRVAPAQILGHEISGTVADLGAGVEGFVPGDAVTVMPLQPCGQCPACHAGHSHICHQLKFLGIDSPGGFQSFWTVPAHTVFKLPPGLPLTLAALVEPIAVACHDVRLASVQRDEFVVVVGGGPIGALIGLVARHEGARVLVSEINPHRAQCLQQLGLETVNPREIDLAKKVDQLTGSAGADVVFEVTGHPAGIEAATKLPRTRGRIMVVGIFGAPAPVDLFRFFWRELRLVGARVYEREDFQRAIDLAASGRLPFASIISEILPMEKAREGLQRMESGGDVMKILLAAE